MSAVVEVEFLALLLYGKRWQRKGIQVAFSERIAAVWEEDGPSSHASVVSLDSLLVNFSKHLDGPDATWMRPIINRLRVGDDPDELRKEAVAAYRKAHLADPEKVTWKVHQNLIDLD